MKRTLALVLAMIMMLTFLPVSGTVKAVETDKAKIYIDYLGSGNAPQDTAQPLPKFDQQAVANGTVIWLGLGIEDLSKLDLAVDGLFNLEVAFDYNPKYLVPCGMNVSEGKDNWYNLVVAANLKSDVAVGDTLYWDANNYVINKDDALFAGSVDVTAGRELPQNMPSDNWDGAWKSVALNIQKKTVDTTATNRFAGTQPAQRSYLVRLPFQLKGIPADGAELKDKMAVVLSLSPNTFVMGSGADGTSPYAQWRANDAVYDDPDTNLKNKLAFGGDIDIFSPSGAVLTGLDIFGVTGTDKQVVTLSPDFAQATTNYTAEIPRDKENLWVQPKIDVDADTAIQSVELVRDGTVVPDQFTLSGDVYTAPVSALKPDDIIKITVVGANSESAVYYVELKAAVELPLVNLELKGQSEGEPDLSITLNPAFDSAAFSYSAQIPGSRTTLLVTASLKNGATLSNIQHLRNGSDLSDLTVNSADNSGTVPVANLQDGDVIRVTGLNADGTNKEYDITMNQAKAYLTALEVYGSKTADDTVVTTPVPLSPSFKWDVENYKIVLPTDSETLNIKPTLPDGCTVQSVERIRKSNDESEDKLSFTSSGDPIVYSASIADITEGDTIHITVTQNDGSTGTYVIAVSILKPDPSSGYNITGVIFSYNASTVPEFTLIPKGTVEVVIDEVTGTRSYYNPADALKLEADAIVVSQVDGDKQGKHYQEFTISGVPEGTYKLIIDKSWHLTYTIYLTISGGDYDISTNTDVAAIMNAKASTAEKAADEYNANAIFLCPGDLDGNGQVTDLDAAVIYTVGTFGSTDADKVAIADIDGNGQVTDLDAAVIYTVGIFGESMTAYVAGHE